MRLTTQQREILAELVRRDHAGRGAQSAYDFKGFETTSEWSGRKYPITVSAAGSVLRRMNKRQPPLVERVGSRPVTYRITDAGQEALR